MKGKHGQVAARRHEAEAQLASLDTYQHAVRRLTAERDELKTRLTEHVQRSARVERTLRTQLAEGVSPQLEAAQRLADRRTQERDEALRKRTDIQRHWEVAAKRLTAHFKEAHGMTALEAVEAMTNLLDIASETDRTLVGDEFVAFTVKHGVKAARAVQRARGQRS